MRFLLALHASRSSTRQNPPDQSECSTNSVAHLTSSVILLSIRYSACHPIYQAGFWIMNNHASLTLHLLLFLHSSISLSFFQFRRASRPIPIRWIWKTWWLDQPLRLRKHRTSTRYKWWGSLLNKEHAFSGWVSERRADRESKTETERE